MNILKEEPVWDEGVKMPSFEGLKENIEVDVAVVGGGLTGLLSAYLLFREGLSVALFEKDKIGRGATGLTTAFLTQHLDTDTNKLISMFGKEKAAAVMKSHAQAIELIGKVAEEEGIACEYMRCPDYQYLNSELESRELKKEKKALENTGVKAELKKDRALQFDNGGYLEIADQGKFHPLMFLAGLARVLRERGVLIYENAPAASMREGRSATLHIKGGRVRAGRVVVATYAPFNRKLYFKKAFYTSYVLEAAVPSGLFPEAIYEDNQNPYHYWRIDRKEDGDRLILGGADHRSDIPVDPEKNFAALEEYLKIILKSAGAGFELRRRWHGPILEPVDGLAFIGVQGAENVFYATGFSGNGMTYAAIAARAAADWATQKDSYLMRLYDADRRPGLKALAYKGADYSGELWGGAVKNTFKHRD